MKTEKELREKFDKEFPELVTLTDHKTYRNVCDKEKVKDFIHKALLSQRQGIIKECEGLKITGPHSQDDKEKAELLQELYDRYIKPELLALLNK
jgi:hypothetical protein